MTIRFLQTTESMAPGYPFMPGQVIHLTGMTPEVQRWLRSGNAEVVRDQTEQAIAEPREHAVLGVGKKRR